MKVLYFMTILIWLSHTDTGGFYRRSNLELNMKVGYKLMQLLLGLFLMKLQIISTETNRYIYAPLKLWFLVPRNIFWINFGIRFYQKNYFQFPLRLLDGDLLLGPAAVPPGAAQAGRHATPARRGGLCLVIYCIYYVYRSASTSTTPPPPLSWWWTQATHCR